MYKFLGEVLAASGRVRNLTLHCKNTAVAECNFNSDSRDFFQHY